MIYLQDIPVGSTIVVNDQFLTFTEMQKGFGVCEVEGNPLLKISLFGKTALVKIKDHYEIEET